MLLFVRKNPDVSAVLREKLNEIQVAKEAEKERNAQMKRPREETPTSDKKQQVANFLISSSDSIQAQIIRTSRSERSLT